MVGRQRRATLHLDWKTHLLNFNLLGVSLQSVPDAPIPWTHGDAGDWSTHLLSFCYNCCSIVSSWCAMASIDFLSVAPTELIGHSVRSNFHGWISSIYELAKNHDEFICPKWWRHSLRGRQHALYTAAVLGVKNPATCTIWIINSSCARVVLQILDQKIDCD